VVGGQGKSYGTLDIAQSLIWCKVPWNFRRIEGLRGTQRNREEESGREQGRVEGVGGGEGERMIESDGE
jgi:hypothetical protein